MRYEDTNQAGGIAQGHGPNAENDLDALTAGSRTPAMGNVITGDGTKSGAAGADMAADGHITSISGRGGTDSDYAGGKLTVDGDYGRLSIDAEGNYRYVPNNNVPENSLDRFVYTLADGNGSSDAAVLTIEFGKTQSVIKTNAQQVVPGPDGVVVLPAGVQLSDIHVVGRNLVIDLPDGSQMVIIDGAVFVPQLSLDGVDVPSTNLAALLIGSEPKPAAGGEPPSSGGNFEVPVPPLDPGVPLGDLIPPTEYTYKPPEVREPLQDVDHKPSVTIDPGNGVAVEAAVDAVNESGLPAREGEPEGSNSGAPSETTTGTIVIDSLDNPSTVTINGVPVSSVGQVIHGQYGDLTITSIANGAIGYSYTLIDNTNGNDTHDDFSVVVTDRDGDTDTATLRVDIIDDVPTARPDTDLVAAGTYGPVTGNVITDTSPGDANDGDNGADTRGADDVTLTLISGAGRSDSSFDEAGNLVIHGQYGVLTIDAEGNYSYVRDPGSPGGVDDIFTYTLKDGDGDETSSTLTIHINDSGTTLDVPTGEEAGTQVNEAGLPVRGSEPEGSGEAADPAVNSDSSEATSGIISFTAPDGPATVTINGTVVTGTVGQSFAGAYGTLVITSYNATTGKIGYTYTLSDNTSGDATHDDFAVVVKDVDGDSTPGTLRIDIVDDVPTARDDGATQAAENASVTINVFANDTPGADGVDIDNSPAAKVAVVANSLTGTGTLTYNNDGTFTYKPGPGEEGIVSFKYTITDGDGDVSEATVKITLLPDSTPRVLIAEGSDTTVNEAGLPVRGSEPEGTGEHTAPGANGDPSEAASGTLIITTGNDTIGKVEVTDKDGHLVDVTNGGTVQGQFGTLIVTGNPTDGYSYKYTLNDNTSGNATHEDFPIKVTDSDGDPDSTTLTINIVDDAPIAENDVDGIASGQYGPAVGNVISGEGTEGGLHGIGEDNVGADNATLLEIHSNNVPANGDATPSGPLGQLVVQGEYGVLTIYANGDYSYVRDPGTPGGVNDVFTYTIKDGDGDPDTATLTIKIGDAGVTVRIPQPGGDTTTVYEAGLPVRGGEHEGTGEQEAAGPNGDPREAVSGTIGFTATDGLGSITLGGVLLSGTYPQTVVTNATGTLVVNGVTFDPVTGLGTISYTYTLTDNTSGNNTNASFALVVTDADGDPSAPGNLVINIIDDAPIAVNDTDSVKEDVTLTATGNVITDNAAGDAGDTDNGKDNVGADNSSVVLIVNSNTGHSDSTTTAGAFDVVGQYGSLNIGTDGSYTYTLQPSLPADAAAVQALDDGETLTETFTYTIRDGDGDETTATLTITINGTNDAPTAQSSSVSVSEEGLSGGQADTVGTPDTTNSATGSGTVVVADVDVEPLTVTLGIPAGSYTSGGVPIVWTPSNGGHTMTGTAGGVPVVVITIDNAGAYNVTLSGPIDHGNTTIEDARSIVIPVSVTDGTATTPATITLSIEDDAPVARADVNVVTEGQVLTVPMNGVLGNDSSGGDGGKTVVGVATGSNTGVNYSANVDVEISGDYGKLTLHADGSYTYKANPDSVTSNQVDHFVYTIRDADGDLSTTTLDITVNNVTLTAQNVTVIVNEAALDLVKADSDLAPGTVIGSQPDLKTETVGGTIVNAFAAANGYTAQTATGTYGVFHLNTDGTYTYTLTKPVDGTTADNGTNTVTGVESFTYTVVDANGNSTTGTVTINVIDDVPTAVDDTGNQSPENAAVTVDVFTNDTKGADGALVSTVALVPGSITVSPGQTAGTLNNNGDGTFTYTPSAGQEGTVTFQYTFVDNDGDKTQATVTINLLPDSVPGVSAPQNLVVDEDGLVGANVDNVPLQGNPGETDSTESRFANGSFTVNYSNDLPANPGTAVVLLDDAALDGQLQTLDGQNVVFALESGKLVGRPVGGGDPVVIISITGNSPVGNVVTYNYQVELLKPVLHADVGNNENNDLLSGIRFQITDKDGDSTTATFNVTVVDDVPSALPVTVSQPSEDANVTFDLHNYVTPGADGVNYANVTHTDATGPGVLSYNPATGVFTYDPAPGQTGAVTFSYTVTDGDGDEVTQNVTLNLLPDSTPSVGTPTNLTLDEDGFANANADNSPLQTTPQPQEVDANEALTNSGTVVVSFGNDAPTGTLTNSITLVDTAALDGQLQLLNGAPVTFALVGGVLIGSAGGTEVIKISITNATVGPNAGQVTYTYQAQLLQPLEHAPGAGENTALLSGVTFQVADSDGDTATGTFNVTVYDDVPSATASLTAPLDAIVVDETRPLGNELNGDNAPGGLASASAGFADNFVTVVPGADGATTAYSLVLSGSNVASGLYALQAGDVSSSDGDGFGQGTQILLNYNAGTGVITGSANGLDYFTISIDANGVVTFTQLEGRNVWHGNTGSDDDTATLTAALNAIQVKQTVTDGDGDVATATVDISRNVFQIEDDGPEAYSPAAVHATNGNTAPVIANLNLDMGTDGLSQLLFSNEYEGDPALDGDGHALMLGGQPLYYHVVGNVLTATTAVGGSGSLGFTVTLNSNGTYTFDVNGVISNGTETSFSNLTSAAAGNVNYRGVGADNASNNTGNTDLLLSASNGGSTATVNTNSTAVGSGNQSMNAGESVRIDFVTNMTTGGGATGFNYGTHVDTNSYEQKIPQVLGSQTATVAIHVWALNSTLTAAGLPDSSPSGGFSDASSTTITTVTITDYDTLVESPPVDISAVAVGVWTTVAFGVSVQKQSDGSVIFSGLQEGDSYSIGTGANNFNAVVVQGVATGTGPAGNVSTTDGFDLGILSIGSTSAGTPIVQNFNIIAIDGDGDPQTGVISTTIDPVVSGGSGARTMVTAIEPVNENLLATNDNGLPNNGQGHGKTFDFESRMIQSANTNSFAVAAAVVGSVGLTGQAAAWDLSDGADHTLATMTLPTQGTSLGANAGLDLVHSALGGEVREAVDLQAVLHNGTTSFDAMDVAVGGGLTGAIQANVQPDTSVQMAPVSAPVDHIGVNAIIAPMVGMPSAEMLATNMADGGLQKAGIVEQVLVDALADHGAPTIDHLLQAVGGPGGGDTGPLSSTLASPDAGHVLTWDMAMTMGSQPGADMMFKVDATLLHHDAVQPTIHG